MSAGSRIVRVFNRRQIGQRWFLLSSAVHNLLVAGGLAAGVRLLGAGFGGLLAGLGAGLLAHGLLVYPAVLAVALPEGAGPMPGAWWWEVWVAQLIVRPLEAVLLAGLLLAALRGQSAAARTTARRRRARAAGGVGSVRRRLRSGPARRCSQERFTRNLERGGSR